ncbi:LysE family translocator [Hypericibacter sp.]|uniref:LysE family translocator n=1 Tax=Hypericibacter sp. TaxID=2705401 RepID=UPI003D6C76A4
MATLTILLALAGIWTVILLTPGPILLMTVRYAVAGRRMAAFQMALGSALAEVIWATGALMGLQAMLAAMAWVYDGLRLVGAALLIVIGIRMIVASFWQGGALSLPDAGMGADRNACRWGFATAAANPNAVVFFSGLFLSLMPVHPSLFLQIAAVAMIGILSLLCDFVLACAFSHPIVRAAYGRARHWLDRIAGCILIAVGFRVAVTR